MGVTRERRTSRRIRSILALSAVVAATVGAVGSPAGAAVPKCQVKNVSNAVGYSDLQAAIDAANLGNTIQVKGICLGDFTVDRDLSFVGKATKSTPKATLDGGGSGNVVKVDDNVTVSFKDLLITRGRAADAGGGIWNDGGSVTLRGSAQVDGNEATNVGGIFNFEGTVNLNGSTQVNGNTAHYNAGGIYNELGTVNLNGSAQVNRNVASGQGGGIFIDDGSST